MRMPLVLMAGAALLVVTSLPASAQLVSERISAERLAALRVGGPDADAGIDDWALQNGTLCAAISDPSHESPLSNQGGVLIDLGHCGRANDQWSTLQPLLNLSRTNVVPLAKVAGEVTASEARLVTEGALEGIALRTRFTLGLARRSVLQVTTEITRTGEAGRFFAYGDVLLHASGQLRPFSLQLRDPERSLGFVYPSADPDSPLSMLRALVDADAVVLVGGETLPATLSYGVVTKRAELQAADGTREAAPTFVNTGESHTIFGVFAQPFFFGGGGDEAPGLLELAQVPFLGLAVGEKLVIEREIHVGERADVASAADAFLPGAVPVTTRVDDAAARIFVATLAGAPVTEVRPSADGGVAFRVPPGAYRLRAGSEDGRAVVREIAVAASGARLEPLVLGTPARVVLPQGRTLRLVFVGVDATPDPRFGDDLLGFRVGSQEIAPSELVNAISLAGAPGDPTELAISPGHYQVLATRGIEYDVKQANLVVGAGERAVLEIADPVRALETPGWISADLHVHSGESFDTSLPLARQLVAFAANGAELIVSTEHNRVIDALPEIARLGLVERLARVVGVEATSAFPGGDTPHTIGHLNAFPLVAQPERYRGGAPRIQGLRVRALAADLRSRAERPLLQLNHPRVLARDQIDAGAFFTHLGVVGAPYDPTQALDAETNRTLVERDAATGLRDLDFDAIELLNGKRMERYRLVRADWISLLLQGEARVGTANSDSHMAHELPAMPRTYVALADDGIASFDETAFMTSLRAGNAFGSSGPLLDVTLGGVGLGGRFAGREGALRVGVRAAPWVPVSELRVWQNGELAEKRAISAGEVAEIPLRFERDAFVFVDVEGVLAPDSLYRKLAPGFTPIAFSNPIFVDADGDGAWTAPGIPAKAPPVLADPLASP